MGSIYRTMPDALYLDDAATKCVVFADVLGFAPLTMQQDDQRANPMPKGFEDLRPSLESVFTQFHDVALHHINTLYERTPESTAIVFSDSLYLALPGFILAAEYAIAMMRDFLLRRVPVRMGLAAGSFQALRFDSQYSTRHAIYSSQFLGKGVVRAYWAGEKSGIKGMRILLHPSLHSVVPEEPKVRRRILLLPAGNAHSFAELNYAYSESSDANGMYVNFPERRTGKLANAVMKMRAGAPESEHVHYDETLEALVRMNEDFGLSPIHIV